MGSGLSCGWYRVDTIGLGELRVPPAGGQDLRKQRGLCVLDPETECGEGSELPLRAVPGKQILTEGCPTAWTTGGLLSCGILLFLPATTYIPAACLHPNSSPPGPALWPPSAALLLLTRSRLPPCHLGQGHLHRGALPDCVLR